MKGNGKKFIAFLVVFVLGICAKAIWDQREQIHDFLSNLFLYYQD